MNQKILYLECNSGISGDMTVGALLDLGADRKVLEEGLASLPLTGYTIRITDVFKSGLRACDFNVILDQDNHDHDMEYLHGSGHTHGHHQEDSGHVHLHTETSHVFRHESSGTAHLHTEAEQLPLHEVSATAHLHTETSHVFRHDSSGTAHFHTEAEHPLPHEVPEPAVHLHTEETPHKHHHDARNLHDILHILEHGNLTKGAFFLASRIFTILAEAEAHVHGKSIEEVHFHEVGAVDSIVDIAAAAICIDNLNPDLTVISTLTDGTGMIRCQHGLIPVPVPAVSAIVSAHGLPLRIRPIEGELVTPTGAAIAAALHTGAALPEEFRIVRVGLGAGKRDYATTGVLRAMLLEAESSQNLQPCSPETLQFSQHADFDTSADTSRHDPLSGNSVPGQPAKSGSPEPPILKLETNIDDCTGEALAFTLDRLMEAGALDVYYTPIYMKKNRPAWMLTVLCPPTKRREMESIIFQNTTTIGIRMIEMNRTRLERRIISLETPWGPADVKCCHFDGEPRYYPENDSVARLAKQENKGFGDMYRMIQECAAKQNTVP